MLTSRASRQGRQSNNKAIRYDERRYQRRRRNAVSFLAASKNDDTPQHPRLLSNRPFHRCRPRRTVIF